LLVLSVPPLSSDEFDWADPSAANGSAQTAGSSKDSTLAEALCSPAFWVYSAASSMFGLTWSAIMLFYELILAERKFDAETYKVAMTVFVAVGMASNLLGGWACRHWPMGRLLAIGLTLLAASICVFPLLREEWQIIAFTAVFGASGGVITVIFFSFYGQAFGRSQLGRIQGAAHILSVFASAIGPVLLTWTKESTGRYDGFYYASVPVLLILGLMGWWVPMPGAANTLVKK
jgi:predicted MFS family arabinose efflux permease